MAETRTPPQSKPPSPLKTSATASQPSPPGANSTSAAARERGSDAAAVAEGHRDGGDGGAAASSQPSSPGTNKRTGNGAGHSDSAVLPATPKPKRPRASTPAERSKLSTASLLSLLRKPPPPAIDRHGVLNVALISLCWCLGLSAFFIQVSTSNAAATLYASSSEGTVPLGALVAVTTLSAPIVPRLAERYGHRRVYLGAVFVAAIGAALNIVAAFEQSFALLVVGALLQGTVYTCTNHLRFAALRFVPPESHANTVAFVVAGGAAAAGLGPELARATRTSLDEIFAGSYIVALALYSAYFVTLLLIDFDSPPREGRPMQLAQAVAGDAAGDERAVTRFGRNDAGVRISVQAEEGDASPVMASTHSPPSASPRSEGSDAADGRRASPASSPLSLQPPPLPFGSAPPLDPGEEPPRSLATLFRQLYVLTALVVATVAYSAMASIMSATPLAMREDGHTFAEQTLTIELHILAMFLPSLISGGMVNVFLPMPVALLGLVVMIAGCLFFLLGDTVSNYNLGIIFVGVGWNFAFVASTKLLTSHCTPAERPRVVALNEFVVLGSVSVLVFAASYSLEEFGFDTFSLLHAVYCLLAALFVKSVMWYRACHPTPEALVSVGLVSAIGSRRASAANSDSDSLASAPGALGRRSRSISAGGMTAPPSRLLQLQAAGGSRPRSSSHSALMGRNAAVRADASAPLDAVAAAAKIRAERAARRTPSSPKLGGSAGSGSSGPPRSRRSSASGAGGQGMASVAEGQEEEAPHAATPATAKGLRRHSSDLRRETVSKTTLVMTPSGPRLDSVV